MASLQPTQIDYLVRFFCLEGGKKKTKTNTANSNSQQKIESPETKDKATGNMKGLGQSPSNKQELSTATGTGLWKITIREPAR